MTAIMSLGAIELPYGHCSGCGEKDPQLYEGEDYTTCCNEGLCEGDGAYRWGCRDKNTADSAGRPAVTAVVSACCRPAAEAAAERAGKVVTGLYLD